MLGTDSFDYHLLTEGVRLSSKVDGLSCEIGLRAGGGSEYIMDALKDFSNKKTHIAIDPYGNIEYETRENLTTRHDYTNEMRNNAISALYSLSNKLSINFIFFNLEDNEFFKSFANGVPVYQEYKKLINSYSFVHFDGPHAFLPVLAEFNFFNERAPSGACFVFDDIKNYDHDKLENDHLFKNDWELVRKTDVKALYQKK